MSDKIICRTQKLEHTSGQGRGQARIVPGQSWPSPAGRGGAARGGAAGTVRPGPRFFVSTPNHRRQPSWTIPRILFPGSALHEKGLQRQGIVPLVSSRKQSGRGPADKPIINRAVTGRQPLDSVYRGFPLFVLPKRRPGRSFSVPWQTGWAVISSARDPPPPRPSHPAPPRFAPPSRAPPSPAPPVVCPGLGFYRLYNPKPGYPTGTAGRGGAEPGGRGWFARGVANRGGASGARRNRGREAWIGSARGRPPTPTSRETKTWTSFRKHERIKSYANRIKEHDERWTSRGQWRSLTKSSVRRTKMKGGYSFFGSARTKNIAPHLRRKPPIFEESSSHLRSSPPKMEEPSSIFDLRGRGTKNPPTFDLRSSAPKIEEPHLPHLRSSAPKIGPKIGRRCGGRGGILRRRCGGRGGILRR